MDITQIDKNFKVQTSLSEKDIVFHSVLEEPFSVYGVFFEDGRFRRLPESVAKSVNPGVLGLHANTAGGRVRFVTDSPYIAVYVKLRNVARSDHFALTGTAGLDLYARDEDGYRYNGTFRFAFDMKDEYDAILYPKRGECSYQIHMPLYSDVEELYIGIKEGSSLKTAEGYPNERPVVFLGSSITQGGCASRPGTSYEAILSRKLNFDYINLGFSGSCFGEDAMMDYIASLPMSLFVYDYDHNAPTPEHLKATHEKGFLRIREKHPTLPILILTAPIWHPDPWWSGRREIVRATYENAKARGDENVYYIDGDELMALCKDEGTVDGCHPTDFGFSSMAEAIERVMKNIPIK